MSCRTAHRGLVAVALMAAALVPAPAVAGPAGSFTVVCRPLDPFAAFDAIVFPGMSGRSHQHAFFGSSAPRDDPGATAASVAAAPSSCVRHNRPTPDGGDHSAYWVPTLVATTPGTVPGVASMGPSTFYYWGPPPRPADFPAEYRDVIEPFPSGIKFVAGTDHTHPETAGGFGTMSPAIHTLGCRAPAVTLLESTGSIGCSASPGTISEIILMINFPQCMNRDARVPAVSTTGDQRDNVEPDDTDGITGIVDYPDPTAKIGSHTGCFREPYRITLPKLQAAITYRVQANARYMFSENPATHPRPGLQPYWTAHADFFDGWDPAELQLLVDRCLKTYSTCSGDSEPDSGDAAEDPAAATAGMVGVAGG